MEQLYVGLAFGISFTVVFFYRLKSTSAGINVIIYNVDRLWHLPIKTLYKHSNNLLAFDFVKNKWNQIPGDMANGVTGIEVSKAQGSGNNSQRIMHFKPKHIVVNEYLVLTTRLLSRDSLFPKSLFSSCLFPSMGEVIYFPLWFIRIPLLFPGSLQKVNMCFTIQVNSV